MTIRSKTIQNNYPYRNMTISELISLYENIIGIIRNEQLNEERPASSLKQETVNEVELSTLDGYLQICGMQEELSRTREASPSVCHDVFENYPVNINYSKTYHALIIDTPVSLASYRTPKGKKQEHLISDLVSAALEEYMADNGIEKFGLGHPYSVMTVRRCLKNQSSKSVPDADNIETRNLINTLVRVLKLNSDSYSDLVNTSCTIEYVDAKEDTGTTFVVIEDVYRIAFEKQFLMNNRSFSFIRQ